MFHKIITDTMTVYELNIGPFSLAIEIDHDR